MKPSWWGREEIREETKLSRIRNHELKESLKI